MSIMKRAMDFLGLGPDDAYDDYDMPPEPERPMRASRAPREPEPARSGRSSSHQEPEEEMVRAAPARPSFPLTNAESNMPRRPQQPSDDSSVQPRPTNPRPPATPTVRTLPIGAGEPATVKPRRFDQAQEIADRFKEGLPVIMNLENTDRDVSRRLIDFASGICYGLDGSMEKVASGVYLLKPLNRQANGYDG
ncbi:MAG: putative cell division protein [Acidimicrobiales bacterium]|nr:putative cell division protein [Acidimicrobiales bacterium]